MNIRRNSIGLFSLFSEGLHHAQHIFSALAEDCLSEAVKLVFTMVVACVAWDP